MRRVYLPHKHDMYSIIHKHTTSLYETDNDTGNKNTK